MKKKVFTAAVVCAISAACIFGATACNNNESEADDYSAQVTEEQWNAAFEKSFTSTNLTKSLYVKVTGTFDGQSYIETHSATTYVVGDEAYFALIITSNDEGGEIFCTETYQKKEGTVEYIVSRDSDTDDWSVSILGDGYSEEGGYLSAIENAPYSAFTYENGKYVGNITITEYDTEITMTATVKINADGYITYLSASVEYEAEGSSLFQESTFYNYGTTTYNFPNDAKQAIEDYKASNN